MTIRDLCHRVVVTIHRQASVEDAARLMRSTHVGDVVVVDAADMRVPIGIITDRDIVVEVIAQGRGAPRTPVGSIMSSPALTLGEDDELLEALDKMSKRGVRRAPVVDRDGHLRGLISVDDLVPLLARELSKVGTLIVHGEAAEIQKTQNKFIDEDVIWRHAIPDKVGRTMTAKGLKDFLDREGVKYVTIRHSPAYTALEIAQAAHIRGKDFAKTVIIKIDDGLAMAVLAASERLDLEHLKKATGAKHVRLALESEFEECFPGCERGAMPPFGNLYGMEVFVSKTLGADEQIAFNAGSHSELIRLSYTDFERLVKPVMAELAGAPNAWV